MSDKPSASTTPATKTPTPGTSTPDDGEIEKLLNREANAFQRELEVERILKAFKLKCVTPVPARIAVMLTRPFCLSSPFYDMLQPGQPI